MQCHSSWDPTVTSSNIRLLVNVVVTKPIHIQTRMHAAFRTGFISQHYCEF